MSTVLEFDGEPFDPFTPSASADVATADVVAASAPAVGPGARTGGSPLQRLRAGVVAAHASALRAQHALALRSLSGAPSRENAAGVVEIPPVPAPPPSEAAFVPLARTEREQLDGADLDGLAAGRIAEVLGARYDQHGTNPGARLRPGRPARLAAVTGFDIRGGAAGRGTLRARVGRLAGPATLADAAREAAEVMALVLGLHLVVPAAPHSDAGESVAHDVDALAGGDLDLRLDVTGVDLVPRPWLRARVLCGHGDTVLAAFPAVLVRIEEAPGTAVAPDADGAVPFLGRFCPNGDRALLNEFHLTHMARGDPGTGHGPPFAHLVDRPATRLPSHGLQFVSRVVTIDGRRGALDTATYVTEYDVPADAWYVAESANADVPNAVLMETSLQSALLVGFYLGATLTDPGQDYVLRNLGGSATLLDDVDLAGRTIRQRSELLSTTPMPGSILQEFGYELSVDGRRCYAGQSMFGYFTADAMARQTGLDGGRDVPTWLASRSEPPPRRTLDVAARRAASPHPGRPTPASAHLALIDEVVVVDGGGHHGRGLLHVEQPVDPTDWFFARHFRFDPVVPGSLGVEQVLQAMQEWALDAGLADGLTDPEFVVPVGATLSWRYRGQVLPTDGVVTLEVHLAGVEHRPGRVRVHGEASLWKPGLRIYEITGAVVELREPGAPTW